MFQSPRALSYKLPRRELYQRRRPPHPQRGGSQWTEHVPITTEERLLYSFRVPYEVPGATKCPAIEGFLSVVVQTLFERRTVCFFKDIFGLVFADALREHFAQNLGLADVQPVLPHGMEDVEEYFGEVLRVRLLDVHQCPLWQERQDRKKKGRLDVGYSKVPLRALAIVFAVRCFCW